jgi:hypothetical protein
MNRKPTSRAKHTQNAQPKPLPQHGPVPMQLTGDRLKLWNDLRNRYAIDSASEALLRTSCEALERAAALAEQVSTEGATFRDRFGGLRVNPAASLERDFRGLASRTLAHLASRLEG